MIGAAGRLYIGGSPTDVTTARDRITECWPVSKDATIDGQLQRCHSATTSPSPNARWPNTALPPTSTLRLLNLSENATYAVEDADDRAAVDPARAPAELPPAASDRVRTGLARGAAPRQRRDRAHGAACPRRPTRRDRECNGTSRHVVHFDMVAGVEPDEETLTVHDFHTLGRITAALHEHSHDLDASAGIRPVLLGLGAQPGRQAAVGPLAGRRWASAPDEQQVLGPGRQKLLRARLDELRDRHRTGSA